MALNGSYRHDGRNKSDNAGFSNGQVGIFDDRSKTPTNRLKTLSRYYSLWGTTVALRQGTTGTAATRSS